MLNPLSPTFVEVCQVPAALRFPEICLLFTSRDRSMDRVIDWPSWQLLM